jgi:hypothetical protein
LGRGKVTFSLLFEFIPPFKEMGVFGCWFKFVLVLPLVTPRLVFPLLTLENCVASDSAIGSENCVIVDPAIDSENYVSVNLAIGSKKLCRCRPSNRERKITSLPIQQSTVTVGLFLAFIFFVRCLHTLFGGPFWLFVPGKMRGAMT